MSAAADVPQRASLDAQGRSSSRLAAVQALYQLEVTQDAADKVIKDFLVGRLGGLAVTQDRDTEHESIVALAELDGELFINLVRAMELRGEEIDTIIQGSLSGEWPWERLEITLRSVLRAGVAELLTRTDIPANVTITEFVDVARAFYAGPESGLTNAVLDRIARALGRTGGSRTGPRDGK